MVLFTEAICESTYAGANGIPPGLSGDQIGGQVMLGLLAKVSRPFTALHVGRLRRGQPDSDVRSARTKRKYMNWFSSRQRRLAPVVMMILSCLYLLWQWFQPQAAGQGIVGIGLVICARLWLVWAALAFLNQGAATPNRFWRLFSTAAILWLGADILRLLFLTFQGEALDAPSVSDLFALAGHLAIFVAVTTYPLSSSERFGRARNFLEIALISISIITLYWLLIAQSTFLVEMTSWVVLFWASLPTAFQLVLVMLILRIWLHPRLPGHMLSFRYWLQGLSLLAFTNLLAGYARILSQPVYGSWLVIGWVAGSMVLSRDFLDTLEESQEEDAKTDESQWTLYELLFKTERWLPIALTTLVVGITLAKWFLTRELDWAGAGAGIALTTLLVARQGVIAGQAELQQYAALINASSDLAFISRSDGSLLLVNPTLERWLGISSSAKDTRVSDFIAEWSKILESRQSGRWTGEARLINFEQESIPVVMSISPIEQGVEAESHLAIIAHDLTEIRTREEELREALDEVASARHDLEKLNRELESKVEERTGELALMVKNLESLNQELKEVDRLKSEFVALVSHELRAPLTTIRGGLEVILEGDTSLPDPVSQSIHLVQTETLRLSNFVELILDLSALEAGRFSLAIEPCSLRVAITVATKQVEQQRALPNIEVILPEELPYLKADERALVSVLFNLLDNASKYAPGSKIEVTAKLEDQRVYVRVSDDGPGIPPEDSERVFDMFHRLDSSDSRAVYGYGLGLPMARRLLQAMEGDIELVEDEMAGTCFELWLPRFE
jgi:PAS domain S-box-containing protein